MQEVAQKILITVCKVCWTWIAGETSHLWYCAYKSIPKSLHMGEDLCGEKDAAIGVLEVIETNDQMLVKS